DALLSASFLRCDGRHRALHSFPTRRSSDLLLLGDDGPGGLVPDRRRGVRRRLVAIGPRRAKRFPCAYRRARAAVDRGVEPARLRSEEHTSELQSRENLVCRLLLEKKK